MDSCCDTRQRPAGPAPRARWCAWAGVGAGLALGLVLCSPVGAAEIATDVACSLPGVVVRATQRDAVALACAGAQDAVDFLAPAGLQPPERLVIELVPQLPPDLRRDAVGCYNLRTHRVSVLTLPKFLARKTWFGVPTNTHLFRSVVAHEVAHALVGCHLGERQLVNAGHEYLAYVTMFATMQPATRSAALSAMPGEGFRWDAEINDMRYALDPMRFGLSAYRHWLRQPDGMAFLQEVLAGRVAPDLNF